MRTGINRLRRGLGLYFMLKGFLVTVLLLLAAGAAQAQETYSVAAPAGYVTRLDRQRIKRNTAVCTRFGLPAACTQAQACTAAGAAGGASCTVTQARASDVEIFAATLAGRETFLIQKGLRILVEKVWTDEDSQSAQTIQCINFRAGNATVKNAMCAAAGAPIPATDCDLCASIIQ